jgi:hypothetical protein
VMDIITAAIGAPFGGTPLPAALVGGCLPGARPSSSAPFQGTGVFVDGLGAAARRRNVSGADTGWTKPLGAEPTTALPYPVQPMTGIAVLGVPANRTTPGDLPPEDPPS